MTDAAASPAPDKQSAGTWKWRHDGRRMFQKEYRMMSFVPRWSIAPRLTQQSDAEHSFFVILYASQLCDWLGISAEETCIILGWAARHDAYEIWTGDPPGPAKHHYIDEDKLKAYVDRFAEQLEDFAAYRKAVYEETVPIDDGRFRDLAVRIIKVADLIDEVMFLRYELALGNVLVKDIFNLSLSRLREKVREWGEDVEEYLMRTVERELARIESEGALIPSLKE